MFKKEAKQFCLNTTLHGYRFIVLPRRILLERFFWIAICLMSLLAAFTLLIFAWLDFRENPIVTVTDSNHYPIWRYPFPGITVCNNNKISKKSALELAQKLSTSSDDKELVNQLRGLIYLIRYNLPQSINESTLIKIQDQLDKNNISVNSVLHSLSYRCEDMLIKCIWKGEEKRCESIFEEIKTTNGFCCSFNYYALKNHTFSGIMAYKSPKNPRRVSSCGYQTGLQAIIENRPNDYFSSWIPSIGYQIMIHNPYTYPDWNSKSYLLRMQSINFIGITPIQTFSTEAVAKISDVTRECWFPHEKKLIYFKYYSFQNCMVECRMNLTLKLCDCVSFLDVPVDADQYLGRVCNLRDIPCLSKHAGLIRSSVPGFNFSNIEPNHEFGNEQGFCNCLSDCETSDFTSENSYGMLKKEFTLNHPTLYGNVNLRNHTVFRVFFNDLVGFRNRKDVRFNWHNLLAFYGGLLGLFMGFSFISGIELLYFFTIRPVTNRKHSKKILRVTNYPIFRTELKKTNA